jgi:DNA end-binding protein Ku
VPSAIKPAEAKLARQVIATFEGELDLREFKDNYQEELRRVIDAKIAGQEVVVPEEEAPAKVVNLMDALRRSLDQVSTGKKKPAKAALAAAAGAEEKPARAAGRKRAR